MAQDTAPVAAQVAAPPVADPFAAELTLEPVASGLRQPVGITHAPDGSGRLFVVERGGTIRVIQEGAVLDTPFLDLSPVVNSAGLEQGLLGLAFHPRYRENGQFFVNYTNTAGDTVVARYRVSADPNVADPGTGEVVLTQDQPFANHNGGHLLFGPDGYLWIGLGDGGSANDPRGNAQDLSTLLGKMLRIDVDGGQPYAIPADNPFVGQPGVRPEIWALGLRNPWRYSFDRATSDLYIADVGQNAWEEVNVVPASAGGLNFGWNLMEGAHCRVGACDPTGLVLPVAEYSRSQGCSVTGGHVYRGTAYPSLAGLYFFGDYCSGRIWSLSPNPDGTWNHVEQLDAGIQISAFGEDEAGEVYVAALRDGVVYRLAAAS